MHKWKVTKSIIYTEKKKYFIYLWFNFTIILYIYNCKTIVLLCVFDTSDCNKFRDTCGNVVRIKTNVVFEISKKYKNRWQKNLIKMQIITENFSLLKIVGKILLYITYI